MFFLPFLFFISASAAVQPLTDESFVAQVGTSDHDWFVKFYAPWCGHCKALAPTWEQLSDSVPDSVKVAKVDATSEVTLSDRFEIKGFPILMYFTEGKQCSYTGNRDLNSLKTWIEQRDFLDSCVDMTPATDNYSGDSEVTELTDANFSTTMTSENDWFVKFYAPWCGHCQALAPIWKELPSKLPSGVKVGQVDLTQNGNLHNRFGITGLPTLYYFTKDKKQCKFNGTREIEKLTEFVTAEKYREDCTDLVADPNASDEISDADSKVVELTDSTFEHLTQASTGATTGDWFVKFYAPWCGHCQKLAPKWKHVAEKASAEGVYSVAHVDISKEESLKTRFNIESLPTLIYFRKGMQCNYVGSREIDTLHSWAMERHASGEGCTSVTPPLSYQALLLKQARQHVLLAVEEAEVLFAFKKNAMIVVAVAGAILGQVVRVVLSFLFQGNGKGAKQL
eukprot:g3844.t1